MKPTSQKSKRQEPGIYDTWVGTTGKVLFKIQKNPITYLGISWLAYTFMDIFSRELLDIEYSFSAVSINLIFALSISPVLFYGIFSGLRDIKHNYQKLLWAIICLFILLILKIAADVSLVSQNYPPMHYWVYGSLRIVTCILVVFPVWALTLIAENYEQKLEKQQEAQRLELENRTLKYNPHLFLNILNDINGKAARLSKPLFDDLTHLNNFFSYALNDEKEKNSLIIQLDVIKSFLHCQDLRFGSSMFLVNKVIVEPSLLTKSINFPENGLIDLVHNMYIHGDLSDPKDPGRLEVKLLIDREIDCPVLTFHSVNKINTNDTVGQGGFGNKATGEFLKQLFPSSRWRETVERNVYELEITIFFN